MAGSVIREDRAGVCTLTFNRPDKLNALSVEVFETLRHYVEALQHDDSIGCVMLRGAGKCFSAGHDLGDIGTGEVVPSRGWHNETLRMLERLPMPVIAAVHGHCYTGALEVALACDFIVASSDARFGDTHAKWALTPVWGMSQRLPRRVGIATAKRLAFTSEMFGAEEALRIGLVECVWPAEEFDARVDAFSAVVTANSRFSQAAYKRLFDATDGMPMDAGLQWEVFRGEGRGADFLDRVTAFQKRKG
ncbi:MAG: enoyl-CoA hydratase/isomerase family protein [Novosphingobium sp.]|uniref:enoyl-CoA hydratase/isomerase family protein n=1 Tax=Novosphingobium sp. TaxID=1874826 RepID=UPI0030195AC5